MRQIMKAPHRRAPCIPSCGTSPTPTLSTRLVCSPRTLSTRIVIGLAAGVALGLLVGDRASVLNIVADGYIKLLQMTVLPFVTVSIIGGVGGLTRPQAQALLEA